MRASDTGSREGLAPNRPGTENWPLRERSGVPQGFPLAGTRLQGREGDERTSLISLAAVLFDLFDHPILVLNQAEVVGLPIKVLSSRAANHVAELKTWFCVRLARPDVSNKPSTAWPFAGR